ncbi:MAG: hypothetical protein KF760_34170 [Candidatus Eremiobacteraeota bacterium]|nr:hypothetical protein [Candidatus Eremiobacteraeota bacterium]
MQNLAAVGSLFWLILPGGWRWLGWLGLAQALELPGWGAVRLLLVQLAAWRHRAAPREVRGLLTLALLLDRCHAAEWSGQDFPMALVLLLGLPASWKSWRSLLAYLGLLWLLQGISDWYGWWGWARPLPHLQETGSRAWCVGFLELGPCALLGAALNRPKLAAILLLLGLAPWPGPVASRAETRRWLGGRALDQPEVKLSEVSAGVDWLLLSNNPERCRGSLGGTLLQATTPAGRGRVLVSHINLGAPADLVVSCLARESAEVRVASARDGSLTDPGSLLLRPAGEWRILAGSWEYRLEGLLLNGMMQLEVKSAGEIEWRVSWNGAGPQLPLREGQSRGLFRRPDRVLSVKKPRGAWHWQSPWLVNEQGQPLLGNYGSCQTLEFEAERAGELWLVARGGLVGAVDGQPGPLLAAGQSRCLVRFGPGPQRVSVWLPVNSFAPYSLVFR